MAVLIRVHIQKFRPLFHSTNRGKWSAQECEQNAKNLCFNVEFEKVKHSKNAIESKRIRIGEEVRIIMVRKFRTQKFNRKNEICVNRKYTLNNCII